MRKKLKEKMENKIEILKSEFHDILKDIIRDCISETEQYTISNKEVDYWVNWLFANYKIEEKDESKKNK